MNDTKKNIESNSGWILCPSKTFTGKFYYFNVLTGESAWSLNQADNKEFKKGSGIHKIADKSHKYPEPTTLPDESTVTSQNISINVEKPDLPPTLSTHQVPTFGQATFPKYVTNIEPLNPNIIWTSVPFPMFCPETKKPMYDKVTQISEFERELFSQSSNVPLCKRFKNYEPPFLSFDRRNKIVKPLSKFEASTPKSSFAECVTETQSCFRKSLIKEPTLKFEPKLPNTKIPDVVKCIEKPIISFGNKVDSTKSSTDIPEIVQENNVLIDSLDSTDLRFLLLAKRKSVDVTTDAAVERKKLKATELNPLPVKKSVSFNIEDGSDVEPCISNVTTQERFVTSNHTITSIDTPKSPAVLKDNTRPPLLKNNYEDASKESAYENTGEPFIQNKTWYIVVDTDVLLLDYELIDKVVLSDPKCKLVIPRVVAEDIEALCLGDCRGQQRVINARQLTRKLAAPPPHYIVEPQGLDKGDIVVTTESILQCCIKAVTKNYYVVLITNDPYLQIRATSLNIPSYKLNEIKNGVEIKPKMTSEPKSIKTNNTFTNDVIDTKNQYNQNLSLLSNLKIKPVEKSIKISISRNDIDEKYQCNQNDSLFNFKSPAKKQLFFSSGSDTDYSSDCDKFKLINDTNYLKNNEIKCDSDGTSDLSTEVTSLKLKDRPFTKIQNVGRNPFLPQNFKENGFGSEKRILNPNTVFNTYTFGKTIPNEKPVLKPNEKDYLVNSENSGKLFCSIPISNMKQFQSLVQIQKSKKPDMSSLSLRQDPNGGNTEKKILNPSQARIKKIICTTNNDSATKSCIDNQTTKTKDSTGLFKIPQLIPIKNGTRNTSVHVENSSVNDKIGTHTTIDSIDEKLKRFRVKSKSMMEKLQTRMDEWVCSYMQIMEDALIHVLQENSVCMENTVAPLTLKDTLHYIKMLYGSHTTIRDITNKLSELIEKCMICVQGKLKMSLVPEDFMKIFGCGVLLVLTLKITLPTKDVLKEAEFRLNSLQRSIESNTREMDPELVKSPSVSRTDKDEEETRPQFIKKKSYIIDYLKNHFSEWASYTEENEENNKIENHSNFKVLRTQGKNLNQLKIDNNKTLSLCNNEMPNNSTNGSKDGPKVKLIENNQIFKPNIEVLTKNLTGTNSIGNNNSENDLFSEGTEILTEKEKNFPLKRLIENIEQEQNASKITEELNFTTHGNTFMGNSEKDGPKIIRNIKLINEFEKKIQNREPLDLDLLDYSEIYEPSVNENVEFDNISEKNNNSEKQINFLEDFYLSPSVSMDSKNNNYTLDSTNTATVDASNKKNDDKTSKNTPVFFFNSIENDKRTEKENLEDESDTYTENVDSRNDSCIVNDNSEIDVDSSENHVKNSETNIELSETPHYDSGTHLENSEVHIESKTAQSIHDDSTNDSGFENDSTCAHTLVKIFLYELSTTFKVIYTFVTKFIDEISEKELSEQRKDVLHNQSSNSLECLVTIIEQLRSIIKRESQEETVLKTLLRNAGVEATADTRMTRYRHIVIKALEQALMLESALKIIVSTTIGDFEAISDNAETIDPSIRYFNIFE